MLLPLARRSVGAIAIATVALRLLTAPGYGIFRDELYYLACADRLDWGYVDHPPMIAALAWLARALFGDSLVGLRALPALAAGATVVLFAALARELGGGRWAQRLAALSAALVPAYLFLFHVLSMNALDIVLCSAAILVATRILRTGEQRLWLAFGAIAGLGLETKLSMGFLVAALVAGLLLTADLRHLRRPWLWLGGALALLIFAPHVVWQIRHGFPTLEFMENARLHKNAPLSPLAFLAEHALELNPLLLPAWLAGLAFYLGRPGRPFRALGIAYLALVAVMLATGGKPYYLSPFLALVVAPAGVMIERVRRPWLAPAAAALLVLLSIPPIPLAVPVLPVDAFVRYARALGVAPQPLERQRLGRLPQHFADMFGWPRLAADVARVVASLPEADRRRACIATGNYGQAAAIEHFGRDLPPVISGHNSYHLWGTRGCDGAVMVIVGEDREDLEGLFDSLEAAAVHRCGDCMPYEDGKPIWIARGFRGDLARAWPALRSYE